MDTNLRKRFQFFFEHAGYVVGARAMGALRLARAEIRAESEGWTCEWEADDCGDLGDHAYWCADAARASVQGKSSRCSHEVLCAVLRDTDGRCIGSLGSVIDPDRNYARVVAAELASEAIEIEKARAMSPIEAVRILSHVWGNAGEIGAHDVAALERVAKPGETLLATCARVAGVDVSRVAPFEHMKIRALCARREIELASGT